MYLVIDLYKLRITAASVHPQVYIPFQLNPLSKTSSSRVASSQCHPHRRSSSIEMIPLFFHHALPKKQPCHTNSLMKYWELLGPNGRFLHELFHNQFAVSCCNFRWPTTTYKTQVMDAPRQHSQHGLPSCIGCGMNNPPRMRKHLPGSSH